MRAPIADRRDVLDRYVTTAPSPANAVEIFGGEWASRFPSPHADLPAGSATLFDDARIAWAIDRIGGVGGFRVLELGPLEAGHTYMLDRAGAREVVAVESNTHAYLKCLIAKEILGIPSGRFLCGDFVAYLRSCDQRFDLVVASGVLYHLVDPVSVIARCAAISDRVFVWSHYYDESVFESTPGMQGRLAAGVDAVTDGFAHRRYLQPYGAALAERGFCGGSREVANWLERDDLLGALAHFGLIEQSIAFEQRDHPHGPALCVLAERPSST